MGASSLSALTIAAIHRYRSSELAARSSGCCRFSPSCSHYAEQALQRRAYPVAVVLIASRVLRCRPSVPFGTWDPAPARRPHVRRRWSAVLLLSGIMTLGTIGLAQAVTPLGLPPTVTQGGCTATINGADVATYHRNNPLIVQKGQAIQVAGLAPQSIRNKPEPAAAATTVAISVELMKPISRSLTSKHGDGYRTFQSTTNVDEYLKWGSGLYRVTVSAIGRTLGTGVNAWSCAATVYIRLAGDSLPGFVAGGAALLGLGGAVSATGKSDWGPNDAAPETKEKNDAGHVVAQGFADVNALISPDPGANRAANTGAAGCALALLAFMFSGVGDGDEDSRPDEALAAALGMSAGGASGGRRFWRRGHTVRGFVSGLVAGLGLTVFMQQRGYWYFTWQNVIALPLLLGLISGVRAWRGRAFVITAVQPTTSDGPED